MIVISNPAKEIATPLNHVEDELWYLIRYTISEPHHLYHECLAQVIGVPVNQISEAWKKLLSLGLVSCSWSGSVLEVNICRPLV